MPKTLTGSQIKPKHWAEAEEFFAEFAELCGRHGVWLRTRTVLIGGVESSETVWRFSARGGRPAFEIAQNGG